MNRRKLSQNAAFSLFWAAGIMSVLIMAVVVGYVLVKGLPGISFDFFTTSPRGGLSGEGGIYSTIVTTFYLVVVTLAFAIPPGVGAAVYFSEYSGSTVGSLTGKLVDLARFGVDTLAGVPSIVFGLFGYAVFVTAMNLGFSILSASMAGACLIIPVIIRTTEDALESVPSGYREGSLALGANRWETTWKVVLPAAFRGISIFFVTLGGSYRVPHSLMSGGRTMALHVYYLAMETRAFDRAMSTAAVLVGLVVVMNLGINTITGRITGKQR